MLALLLVMLLLCSQASHAQECLKLSLFDISHHGDIQDVNDPPPSPYCVHFVCVRAVLPVIETSEGVERDNAEKEECVGKSPDTAKHADSMQKAVGSPSCAVRVFIIKD